MPRRRSAPALLVLLAAPLLAGCFYQAPAFRVTDVRLTDRSDEAYVLTFVLEGENANDVPLPLTEVRYTLSLDGSRVFSGRRSPQATLPPAGAQRVEMPASVPLADGPQPIGQADYRLAGSITYQVPGAIAEILYDTSVRRPSVGFGESGTMEFAGPAETAPTAAPPAGAETPGG